MKQRTAYWIPTINVLVILAVLCMLGSAVVRIMFYAGETQIPGSILAFQILLPLAANVLFALLLPPADGTRSIGPPSLCGWGACSSR